MLNKDESVAGFWQVMSMMNCFEPKPISLEEEDVQNKDENVAGSWQVPPQKTPQAAVQS